MQRIANFKVSKVGGEWSQGKDRHNFFIVVWNYTKHFVITFLNIHLFNGVRSSGVSTFCYLKPTVTFNSSPLYISVNWERINHNEFNNNMFIFSQSVLWIIESLSISIKIQIHKVWIQSLSPGCGGFFVWGTPSVWAWLW